MSNDIILFFFIAVVLVYVFLLYQNNSQKQAQYDQKLNEIKIISQPAPKPKVDPIVARDTAVVNDPLYPPIGRQPRPLADDYLDYKRAGLMWVLNHTDYCSATHN